jgi:hypothetical protein
MSVSSLSEVKKSFFNSQNLATDNSISHHLSYQAIREQFKDIQAEYLYVWLVLKHESKNTDNTVYWNYLGWLNKQLYIYYDGKSFDKLKKKAFARSAIIQTILKPSSSQIQSTNSLAISYERYLFENMIDWLKDLKSISYARNYVALTNLYRLYFVFLRLTTLHVINYLKWIEIWKTIPFLAGANVNWVLDLFQDPGLLMGLNVLSVTLFFMRALINCVKVLIYTFSPPDGDKDMRRRQRIANGLQDKQLEFINDFIWMCINFLTNFNKITKLPVKACLILAAIGMAFDVLLLSYRLILSYRAMQYQLRRLSDEYNVIEDKKKKAFVTAQIRQMKIQHYGEMSKVAYYISGAFSLFIGFSVTYFGMTPISAPIGMIFCMLGAAIYLSADNFKAIIDAKLQLNEALVNKNNQNYQLSKPTDKMIEHYRATYRKALYQYFFVFFETLLVPTLLMAAYASLWQLAIPLTVVYIIAKYAYSRYQYNKSQNPPIDNMSNQNNKNETGMNPVKSSSENQTEEIPSDDRPYFHLALA